MLCLALLCLIAINTSWNLEKSEMRRINQTASPGVPSSPIEAWRQNPLGIIPPGSPPNLPSIRTEQDFGRKIYGGAGDKAHLGGFTELDLHGVTPALWSHLVGTEGVHSVLDIGCGRGVSTSWFGLHGVKIQCVEGSHDAVVQSLLPEAGFPNAVVEHDFSRGPWWPADTYDMGWAVEFLEHVGINYQHNYVAAMRKCALILVTSSRWGGWHHVEVHQDEWWIRKYESFGFRFDSKLTEKYKEIVRKESGTGIAPNGEHYNAQHLSLSLKVFINPAVASLPQHAHLFFEHGCFQGRNMDPRVCGVGGGSQAGVESVLPPEFLPLKLNASQDDAWMKLVQSHIQKDTAEGKAQAA